MRKLLLPFVLLLAACGLNLDTNEKRLLAAEVTFKELTVIAVDVYPQLSVNTRLKVDGIITDAHKALVFAREALVISDQLNFDSKLSTVNSLLRVLRPILEDMEVSYVWQSYSFA